VTSLLEVQEHRRETARTIIRKTIVEDQLMDRIVKHYECSRRIITKQEKSQIEIKLEPKGPART